ncbi:16S rRNA (uracil(1498)-N(3))-methyltransferase [Sphingomonas paeninsulae]|uniref:Ribosomal RNA small subunit methyltransferase E n=1 Tax=Sphingomonas paeninsulae TaxID=2319844 RepID=A0A494TLS4_SPHPE|nr:16S rRNA (uracil(1498)-N(3))-methyltransferase [Sphingomonas paeninsulae]AYJ87963.1 16S rRNA (uracil(1498)-N(3))-methyltransferase [Sphingomonas paeninsulae]
MPATPAWPPESSVRLFVETRLSENAQIRLDGAQAHYLVSVMRIKTGEHVKLFDDATGEWLAEAIMVGKRDIALNMVAHLKPREPVPDLWLAAAPIRRARYDWVAEKACELGVARFVPVLTRRAVVDKVKDDRLRAHMIEAAEQCGRTALPEISAQIKLLDWLKTLEGRTLFFADEAGGEPFATAIAANPGPAAVLIGPEGGFDDAERDAIRGVPTAVPITLGPRILRADTAAIAAISVWMALSL